MENNQNILEEFNIYYLLKNLWTNRKFFLGIISLFIISSVIYSLVVDHEYEVRAVIKPADANEETTLNDKPPLMGFGIGGYTTYPVINDVMITLKSDTFLEILFDKYSGEEKIFKDKLRKIDEEITDPEENRAMRRYIGLKILRKAVDFSVDSDHNIINISVRMKDKHIAYFFINDLLENLRSYIRTHNVKNLEEDISFFRDLIEKSSDPLITQVLEKKLSEKIERKFNLSSNVFTVTSKPVIPAKRVFPKRSFIVIMTTMIGFIVSMLTVSLIPPVKKIIKYMKEN